jgi:anaerobic selenocysteine-containing dehydrogenase
MAHFSRRDFLKTGLAAGALAGSGSLLKLKAARASATDWVTGGRITTQISGRSKSFCAI